MIGTNTKSIPTRTTTSFTYSIVAPVFNEEETISYFYKRIIEAMEPLNEPF